DFIADALLESVRDGKSGRANVGLAPTKLERETPPLDYKIRRIAGPGSPRGADSTGSVGCGQTRWARGAAPEGEKPHLATAAVCCLTGRATDFETWSSGPCAHLNR